MTDLDITMGVKEELPPPSDDDKRLVDSIKNLPPQVEEEHKPTDDGESEAEMTFEAPEEQDELEPKEVIDEKKIFKQDKDEPVEDEDPPPKVKKISKTTEKQREHLKKAREKALATRRKNAAARKVLADEKKAERDEKREEKLLKIISKEDREFKQKQKKVAFVPESIGKSFTDEQIIDLQQKAIENYEVKRKARKEVKKKEQQKVAQDKKTYDMINKAVNPDPEDVWAACFQ
jgi:hypothetical protein